MNGDDPCEKFNDGRGKDVIAVASHHMAGTGDVDVLRCRAQLQESLRALFAQQVRQAAAHQQGR